MTRALLARAEREGAPLIDGDSVTFVWRGRNPPDGSEPRLLGDFNNWDIANPIALARASAGVWTHTLDLPPDAYIEYAYVRPDALVKHGNPERVPDPFNRRRTPNGLGKFNHFFYMPQAAPVRFTRRAKNVPRGVLTRHVLKVPNLVAGGERAAWLYQPPGDEPTPLLLVYDGADYLRRARLVAMVEGLMAQRRIAPLALALLANGRQARMIEYACSDATLSFVTQHVLPLARRELNLLDPAESSGAFGVLGASMGGLMALYTGLRLPQVFGRVLSQSGAFILPDHEFVTAQLLREGERKPLRIWMDVGRYEWLLQSNRTTHDLLRARGYAVEYREFNAGHNYPAWRDDLPRGLEAMFGDVKRET